MDCDLFVQAPSSHPDSTTRTFLYALALKPPTNGRKIRGCSCATPCAQSRPSAYDRWPGTDDHQHPFIAVTVCRYYGHPGYTAPIGHFLLSILRLSESWGVPLTDALLPAGAQSDTGQCEGHNVYCEVALTANPHPCARVLAGMA
jgi:hypothetical protein